jgi:hypothetical protein
MRGSRLEPVAVLGCGAFVPGFAGLAGWLEDEANAAYEEPTGAIVPVRQRRRASPLSKALADAYAEALQEAGLEPDTVASVFGSALGEASTMIGLLEQLWDEDANLSPMRFATSVHNAASGMISIATRNRGITTSIGADYDTPAMALLEGIGMVVADGCPVLVCCGDEAPPAKLLKEGEGWGLLSAAIAIGPSNRAPASCARLSEVSITAASWSPRTIPPALGSNPNVGLLDLILAIRKGAEGWIGLDRGSGRGYSIRLHAAST